MTGVFPLALKTAKVVPVFKKDSKSDISNYCQISSLSNIEKTLENLCIKCCIPFPITKIFSITYGWGSDDNILHLMP